MKDGDRRYRVIWTADAWRADAMPGIDVGQVYLTGNSASKKRCRRVRWTTASSWHDSSDRGQPSIRAAIEAAIYSCAFAAWWKFGRTGEPEDGFAVAAEIAKLMRLHRKIESRRKEATSDA